MFELAVNALLEIYEPWIYLAAVGFLLATLFWSVLGAVMLIMRRMVSTAFY